MPNHQPAKPKCSILLVDDNRLFIATMTRELQVGGYHVTNAGSVDKALLWLKNGEKPDVVVIDVNMPGRSGLELAESLNEFNHIPFIMLTASNDEEIIDKANMLGAMSYLLKPIDSTQLIPVIETVLARTNELKSTQHTKLQLQSVLDSNREINIAIGITMMKCSRDRDAAFELLRSAARSQNRKLTEVAEDVINSSEAVIRQSGK